MSDITPEHFAALKARALAKAKELMDTSFTGYCLRCQRTTLHRLTGRIAQQQIYKCCGCGESDAYPVKP